jgi:hypothetical protein
MDYRLFRSPSMKIEFPHTRRTEIAGRGMWRSEFVMQWDWRKGIQMH